MLRIRSVEYARVSLVTRLPKSVSVLRTDLPRLGVSACASGQPSARIGSLATRSAHPVMELACRERESNPHEVVLGGF